MARPPKNAEGPSATERMEMAFWSCLKDMPFSEITVRDIVGHAAVNRNSYYYHYDSMWDLAQASVRNATLPEFAQLLLGGRPSPLQDAERLSACFEHLRVLFGPNGNQRLVDDAKRIIVREWLAEHSVESDDLDTATQAAIDFVFGGMAELIASENFESLDELMASIEESPLLSQSIAIMRRELDGGASTSLPAETLVVEKRAERVVTVEEVTDVIIASSDEKEEQVSVNQAQAVDESREILAASSKADELVAAELEAFAKRHETERLESEPSENEMVPDEIESSEEAIPVETDVDAKEPAPAEDDSQLSFDFLF